ncbi:hypothetical protein BU24DRAFT_80451 [Aaosphaeria arxii CBS 175.79]|uniref:Uncharacterized protein n=1 Tax=Aaosphaeria arxii CBS 175.79 TaxID=1450172 RepID=A0A6A5X9M7_9PLEO|nr:uncharacterized protein BU24DRAFT_80451 [Aaosphaeria arxii CBS 175.79]KAF2009661.1 hypothetical protein BU24DRAFT_80451 [Aaosphaeria arxii CBS 175.79]
MALGHRLVVAATSALILVILALTLIASLEIRAPLKKIKQIAIAQEAKLGQWENELKAKGLVNGTGFDRADVISGTMTVSPGMPTTLYISVTGRPTTTSATDGQGMIGETPTPAPQPTYTSVDEGMIGTEPTRQPQPSPPPPPAPAPNPQVPILALSYAGSGGPKHCRGDLLQKLTIPQPASDWKNGTCIDLPRMARCGVFYAGKEAGCEAQLFNSPACYKTNETFVNTVIFMPEERTVGAYWRSMWIRCGVEAPEAKLLDPSILNGLLKKPGNG